MKKIIISEEQLDYIIKQQIIKNNSLKEQDMKSWFKNNILRQNANQDVNQMGMQSIGPKYKSEESPMDTNTLKCPEKLKPYRDKLLKWFYTKIPYYAYYVVRFLLLKEEPVRNEEVPADVINTLSDMLCEKSKRMGTCNPSKWTGNDIRGHQNIKYFGYADATSSYSKSPTFGSKTISLNQPTNIKNVSWVIGQAGVTQSGNNWLIQDVYNFDNVMEKHKFLKTDSSLMSVMNVIMGFLRALGGLVKLGSVSGGIEQILTQYHNRGYRGFNTIWYVPMGNCKCGGTPSQKTTNNVPPRKV